jgi:hypothetical protein
MGSTGQAVVLLEARHLRPLENDLPAVIVPPIASLDCGRSSIDHWGSKDMREPA